MSIKPVATSLAMCAVAVKPLEQNREELCAAVVFGKPAARAAARQ